MSSVDFSYLATSLEQDGLLRESIREQARLVEREERTISANLNRVQALNQEDTLVLLKSLPAQFAQLSTAIGALAALIPAGQFYRYNDIFSRAMQTASFMVVLAAFLESEQVPTKAQVEQTLAISPEWSDHFFLPSEDYLHSLISLVNELSRLAVNRVTLGDFEAPVRYSAFAKELSSAFGLLNLKNDSLRKRFDSIKYDVKKLEEVVYDLSLRGLLASSPKGMTSQDGQQPTKRARTEEQPQA